MAGENRVARVLLEFEVNKAKSQEAFQAAVDQQKAIKALGPAAFEASKGVQELNQRFDESLKRAREARAEFRGTYLGLDTSLKNASDGSLSLVGNLQKVRDELQKIKDKADETGPSLDSLTGDSGVSGSGVGVRRGGLFRAGGQILDQIDPGAGGAVRQIGEVTGALGELGTVGLVAGPIVAGVGLIIRELARQAEQAHDRLETNLGLLGQYYGLIVTGNEEAVKAERDKLELQKKAQEQELALLKPIQDQISKIRNSFVGDEGAASGSANDPVFQQLLEPFRKQLEASGLLNESEKITAGTTDDLTSRVNDLQQSIDNAGKQSDRYTKALNDGTVAAYAATSAEQQLAAARKQLGIIGENAADLNQILNLEATATNTQQVQDLVDAKKREIITNQYARDASLEYAATLDKNSQEYKDAITQADKYGDAVSRDINLIDRINAKTYEVVGAREKELQTLEKTKAYNDQRTKDTDAYLAKITDLETKSAEKLIDLATRRAEQESAILSKLSDKLASLDLARDRALEDAKTKESRAELEDQIKAQRIIAKNAKEHAANLIKIQADANARAADLISARDFSGLFKLRRDTATQLQAENSRYDQQTQEQLDALKEQRDDRLRAYGYEAIDRQTKYTRDVQDARAAATKEINENVAKYNKAFNLQQAATRREESLLNNKYNEQARLLQQATTHELQMIQNGNIARALLQNAANQTLLQQAQELLSGLTGLTNSSLGLGIPASVNSIHNNRSVRASFNINGQNSDNVAQAVLSKLKYLVN